MLTVCKDLDKKGKRVEPSKVIEGGPMIIGTLEKGMESGRTSVTVIIPLEDGRQVVGQCSLREFKGAVTMLTEIPE